MNGSKDVISVLLSIYNEPIPWVRQTLISVVDQKTDGLFYIELIVILDNPQRENEIDILIAEFRSGFHNRVNIKYIINENNLGLANSLNTAFKKSSGAYIARIDADDINYPQRFLSQYKYLKNNVGARFVGSGITRIDADGKILNDVYASNNFDLLRIKVAYSSISYHPTWFMERSVLLELGGYNPYPNAEDFDFLLRAVKNKIVIHNITEPLVYYRINENSLSNKNGLQQRKCQFYILKKHFSSKENSEKDFNLNEVNKYIKSTSFSRRNHEISQKKFISAMTLLANKRYITGCFVLIQSMTLSPWQLRHVLRQVKFKLIVKIKRI